MKTLFYILLFQIPMLLFAQGKVIKIYPGKDSMAYYPDVMKSLNPQPGDTLMFMNNARYFKGAYLGNLCGTAGKPFVVTQENPLKGWGGYGGYTLNVIGAANVVFTNLNIDAKGKGNSCFTISHFQHVRILNSVFRNAYAFGLGIKTDFNPKDIVNTSFPRINTDIEVAYCKIEGSGTENVYAGTSWVTHTSYPGVRSMPIIGFKFHHNEMNESGWDGAQFSNVQGLDYNNNTVTNYGKLNVKSQQAGVLFGTNVTLSDTAHNNVVSNGTGTGVLILGSGAMAYKNWDILGTAKSAGENGIFIDDRANVFGLPVQKIYMENIKVEGAAKAPIYYQNNRGTALPIEMHNYTFSNTAVALFDASKGRFWNDPVVVTPPPVEPIPVPVDTPVVVVSKNDTIYTTVSGNYTVKATKQPQVITFSAAGKVYLPTQKVDSMYVRIENPKGYKIALGNRWYFTNGKYRLIVGYMMAGRYKVSKSKMYIVDRRDFKK